MTHDDEPVGYLGGAAAADEEDPYALPPASEDPPADGDPAEEDSYALPPAALPPAALPPAADDPYGDPVDENPYATDEAEYALPGTEGEPEFALPGSEGVDDAYALPGASGDDDPEHSLPATAEAEADYSASDFMADGGGAETETYDDPYETQDGYQDEYGSYENAEADDGYYDSMGHEGDGPETGMATETEAGYDTEEFADDDQPKTISQQDAESIIRRITTKRILPPEQQEAGAMTRPQPLTPGGGALKIWPILIVLLLMGGGAAFVFRKQLGFGSGGPEIGPTAGTPKPTLSAQERARRELVKRILTSEAKAFDRKPEDLLNAKTGAAKIGAAKTKKK
ncbi:MAG: hypothetical protein JKY65_08635 [Planctomycetes bacterium]|nr:hypothetical protein [Planctomycetota bacterium]